MRLFRVTKDYLKEIQKISSFIPQQEEVLGTVLRINGYIYFLPINNEDSSDYGNEDSEVFLPKGTIKKLIGRELTWENEPVELKEE